MAAKNFYEVILSINGKYVPVVSWDGESSGDATLELIRYVFRRFVYLLALQSERPKDTTNSPYCQDHQVPMMSRKGKFGVFWSCPKKDDQGNYCKYRPGKA
jgi:hypothetical protein